MRQRLDQLFRQAAIARHFFQRGPGRRHRLDRPDHRQLGGQPEQPLQPRQRCGIGQLVEQDGVDSLGQPRQMERSRRRYLDRKPPRRSASRAPRRSASGRPDNRKRCTSGPTSARQASLPQPPARRTGPPVRTARDRPPAASARRPDDAPASRSPGPPPRSPSDTHGCGNAALAKGAVSARPAGQARHRGFGPRRGGRQSQTRKFDHTVRISRRFIASSILPSSVVDRLFDLHACL